MPPLNDTPPTNATPTRPYAELRASSSFSFLNASSLPEDLIYHAATLDVPAMAIVDANGYWSGTSEINTSFVVNN